MFGCYNRQSLPTSDPYVNKYFCGSNELFLAYVLMFGILLLFVFISVLVARYKYKLPMNGVLRILGIIYTQLKNTLYNMIFGHTSKNNLSDAFKIHVPVIYATSERYISLVYTQIFFMTLYDLCKLVIIFSMVVLLLFMPLFIMIKSG